MALGLIATGMNPQTAIHSALACASLLGTAVISYVTWPKRWNILAHSQLAFGVVAYIIPILFLRGLENLSVDVVGLYTSVLTVGAVASLTGTVIGGAVSDHPSVWRALSSILGRAQSQAHTLLPRRTALISIGALALVFFSFAVMGFIPALAEDPYAAKFFRGEYAESYSPVALPYRVGTSLLAVLVPLLGMYALWRRGWVWLALLVGAVGTLLLTLQREPALSGLLIAAGVAIALRGRYMAVYLIALIAVYFAGSASYFLLAALGIGSFSLASGPTGLLESVAAGAPDVADHTLFLRFWTEDPVYADGRTFIGGLIPSGFEWNPAVWTLAVTNPGADISTIPSGGFRLPSALWGYLNFAWPGVILVGLIIGFATGILAATAARYFDSTPPVLLRPTVTERRRAQEVGVSYLLYVATIEVVNQAASLSYVTVIQGAVLVALLLVPRVRVLDGRPTP